MITQRQSEALWGAFEHGSPFRVGPGGDHQGVRSRAGGALHRMIENLRSGGYLSSRKRLGYEHANEITAKGLSALIEVFRKKEKARGLSVDQKAEFYTQIGRLLAALKTAEAKEAAASEAASADAAERRRQQAERAAAWRVRKSAAMRAYFDGLATENAALAVAIAAIRRLDDEALLAFVDGIVDREASI